jgi:hypothetical protein
MFLTSPETCSLSDFGVVNAYKDAGGSSETESLRNRLYENIGDDYKYVGVLVICIL